MDWFDGLDAGSLNANFIYDIGLYIVVKIKYLFLQEWNSGIFGRRSDIDGND
jgi:hypothetical protein